MALQDDNANLPVSNRPETILSVTIASLVVTIIAISLRLYVRYRERLCGWDDLFVFFAGISTTVGSSLTCLMPGIGLGKHFWTLKEHNIMEYFKMIWATNITYSTSTTFIKVAILLQYLRLFDSYHPVARKLTWGVLIFAAMWGFTFTLLALFSCRPIAKNWNTKLPGTCVAWGSKNPDVFFASWIAHASSNMLLDILVLVLPIPFVHQLRFTGKTRIGLIALFTMGGIVATLSVARVISLSIRRVGTVPVFDPTYATPTVYIFSVLEINVAILCASIPIFWPLVTSLGSNKILIVNEVEVRTERRSETIALAEQGKSHDDTKAPDPGKSPQRTASRLARTLSRQHRQHPSNASSTHAPARTSQDSQRNLKLSHQTSNISMDSSSLSRKDPLAALEPCADATVARYQDKYMQEWAVPDFDSGAPRAPRGGTYTAAVERAQIPYDHIRALEK